MNLLSVYFQDDVRITSRLRISPGIRLDYTGLPKKPGINPNVPLTNRIDNSFLNTVQLSFRLGFNYDLNGDRSLVIWGRSGTFTGRMPFARLGYACYNDGVGFGAYDYNNLQAVPASTLTKFDPLNPATGGASGYNAQTLVLLCGPGSRCFPFAGPTG